MNAAEVKDALYRRHAATDQFGGPGPWTCIEEWHNIDLLAFSSWSKPYPARARYSRIGYEVKVSRSDYRTELLNPYKRSGAVAFCHEFYFAVPAGLLKPEEVAYEEPEWEPADFDRERCPENCHRVSPYDGEVAFKGTGRYVQLACRWPRPAPERSWMEPIMGYVQCETCAGRGYLAKSRVELEAPTLWVPADVGLIEVNDRGCTVVRPAPLRDPNGISTDNSLAALVRWVSWRPDPRHAQARPGRPVDALAEEV